MPCVIYRLLRPLLFRLDPERAHAASIALLRLVGALSPLAAIARAGLARRGGPPVQVFGLRFANPIGLAAGYDKDALAWRGLACLGFGHIEIGTVTPLAQAGNPRPRVFRLVEERSLINRLGFPSRGSEFVLARLHSARRPSDLVLGVNLGRQRATPADRAVEDYELLLERFAPVADYLAVNVSSPNTPDLRRLQEPARLRPLLERLASRRDELRERLGKPLPLLVKLSPDLDDDGLGSALDAIVVSGMDGVVATNTTTSRPGLDSTLARQEGGLSGAALRERSTEMVRKIVAGSAGRLPVVASGGVMGPRDARAKLDAGACLVQVYTGLVYEGPGLVRRILRDL